MASSGNARRRPSVHVTLPRAARLHQLVTLLAENPRGRNEILTTLRVGLRTFYRELVLLKRCGVKVRHKAKLYHLMHTASEAEGRLPFPDPQLSFAEMAELARCPCPAGQRLADLLAWVVAQPEPSPQRGSGGRKGAKAKSKTGRN
ncbi:MAG: hypothetical protein ACLQVF_42525 [Isosphaeraceae bacterium]